MAVRSESEIRRAISVLTGVGMCAAAEHETLPRICGSELEAFYLALDWVRGGENRFGEMLQGFTQVFQRNGTGIDDEGKPYDLQKTN